MKPEKLREMIFQHKREGRKPFFVNCTAGTTVMGAFDPVDEIANICQEQGIWMHVDVSMKNYSLASPVFLVAKNLISAS